MYIVPFSGRGGEFFQVIWEDFQVVQVGKEEKGRERRKGDEKTKRKKEEKGIKGDKKGRKGSNKEKKEGKFGQFFKLHGGKIFKMNGTIYIPELILM